MDLIEKNYIDISQRKNSIRCYFDFSYITMNRYVLTILVALLLFGSFETNSVLARSSRTSSSDIYVS